MEGASRLTMNSSGGDKGGDEEMKEIRMYVHGDSEGEERAARRKRKERGEGCRSPRKVWPGLGKPGVGRGQLLPRTT